MKSISSHSEAGHRNTTIYEIAKAANVSPVTVSRAFSKKAPVAEKTRKTIFAAAKRLGYQPDPVARAMRGLPTHTLGVLWSLAGFHQSGRVIRAISLQMQQHDYFVNPVDHLSDPDISAKALADFARRRVDAVVLQADRFLSVNEDIISPLSTFRAAVVVLTSPAPFQDRPLLDVIEHDRALGFYQVGRHFALSGRRRPAILGSVVHTPEKVDAFFDGYHSAAASPCPRLAFDTGGLRYHDDSIATNCRLAIERAQEPFDALICTDDELAAVAMGVLTDRGRTIGGSADDANSVALVGFNNSTWTACLRPHLASIERNDDDVARLAVEMIMSRLEEREMPARRQVVTGRFVWRPSAGGTGENQP